MLTVPKEYRADFVSSVEQRFHQAFKQILFEMDETGQKSIQYGIRNPALL